jgi:hypothetical protein
MIVFRASRRGEGCGRTGAAESVILQELVEKRDAGRPKLADQKW